jgi:hypothetical protein
MKEERYSFTGGWNHDEQGIPDIHDNMKLIDLSHPFFDGMPVYPGYASCQTGYPVLSGNAADRFAASDSGWPWVAG